MSEGALCAHRSAGAAAVANLRDLLRRLTERHRGEDLSDEAAMGLAVEETRAVVVEQLTDRPE